jgi:hypothetical protein
MGRSDVNPVFDEVARKMSELGVADDIRTEVLSVLISQLQEYDWDTEDESLAEFEDDPAVVEAFRRNDIVIRCGGDADCHLERGHGGNVHRDYFGTETPVDSAAT